MIVWSFFLRRFATAIIDHNIDSWVMNVVPTSGPNTLPVIYDRGFIGVNHDWYGSCTRSFLFWNNICIVNCRYTLMHNKSEHRLILIACYHRVERYFVLYTLPFWWKYLISASSHANWTSGNRFLRIHNGCLSMGRNLRYYLDKTCLFTHSIYTLYPSPHLFLFIIITYLSCCMPWKHLKWYQQYCTSIYFVSRSLRISSAGVSHLIHIQEHMICCMHPASFSTEKKRWVSYL